jgi:hypothetical protein
VVGRTCATKLGWCLLVLLLALVVPVAPAHANTSTIDGISDQSLPAWDGAFADSYFAELFRAEWDSASRIRYARYVVQWNVMATGHGVERAAFASWLRDVASLGLIPDVALTSYDGIRPVSPTEYAARLAELLERAAAIGEPLPYVEAWNEPNNQGDESAPAAARLANAAQTLCATRYGCAVIAGDFEDRPGLVVYERRYERNLDFAPAIWGVHPYWSVQAMSEAPYLSVLRNLPDEGAGAQVWITEIAARKCTDYGGALVEYGEAGQALRAHWLVDTLLRNHPPAHAFYYEFLLGDRRQPSCASEPEDGALYVPAGPGEAPSGYLGVLDRPRLAARYIWAGPGLPWEPGGLLGEDAALPLGAGGSAAGDLPAAVFGLGVPMLAPPPSP